MAWDADVKTMDKPKTVSKPRKAAQRKVWSSGKKIIAAPNHCRQLSIVGSGPLPVTPASADGVPIVQSRVPGQIG